MRFLPRPSDPHCRAFFDFRDVAQDDLLVIDHPELQDGSTYTWAPEVVAPHIDKFVQKFGINTVRYVAQL